MTFVRFFLKNFYCITVLIFCKIFLNHQINPFIVIKKNLRLFFDYTKAQNDHVTVYSRNKVGQNRTVFFQKMLKSHFETSEYVL